MWFSQDSIARYPNSLYVFPCVLLADVYVSSCHTAIAWRPLKLLYETLTASPASVSFTALSSFPDSSVIEMMLIGSQTLHSSPPPPPPL